MVEIAIDGSKHGIVRILAMSEGIVEEEEKNGGTAGGGRGRQRKQQVTHFSVERGNRSSVSLVFLTSPLPDLFLPPRCN